MASSLPTGTTAPRGLDLAAMRWPLVPSRDLFELKYGKALVEADRRPGEIPVYGTNGQCGTHDVPLFRGPGVILGRKGQGPLGVEWCPTDYWVIDTAYALAPVRDDIDLRYAYYLIRFVGLNHLKDGTSNPTLSRDSFGSQAFPLPPVAEQRRIAHILGALDDKIELTRRMSQTLESMSRALFKSWFVHFAAAGAGSGTLQDSEAGPIPEGWTAGRISDLLTLERGLSYNGVGLSDTGHPMVTLGCFGPSGEFQESGLKRYRGEYRPRHIVQPGDLLLANTDITQKREVLGSPVLLPPWLGEGACIFTHHVFAARLFARWGDEWRSYLYYTLLQESFRERARGFATGTTVLSLPADAVLDYTVPMPPGSIVKAFDTAVAPLRARRWQALSECRALEVVRDRLLAGLVSARLE